MSETGCLVPLTTPVSAYIVGHRAPGPGDRVTTRRRRSERETPVSVCAPVPVQKSRSQRLGFTTLPKEVTSREASRTAESLFLVSPTGTRRTQTDLRPT